MPKNFAPKHHFTLAKAFEVPRNFSRKVSCVGGWGGQPRLITNAKNADFSAFFILSKCVGTAVRGPCFKRLFEKSPLKIRKTFPRTHNFIFAKLLKFQETFLEKFLASGFGADAPTFNTHTKKHGDAVLFLF